MEKDSFPSPAQLALAMAIVKQKPAGVEVKEHILQLRQYIQKARDSSLSSSEDKFLDSVSFWQRAFEKSEAEQSKLLDRIYELEQRNETLIAKTQPGSDAAEEKMTAQESSKRKGNANKNASASRKRAKTQAFTQSGCLLGGGQGDFSGCFDRFEYMEEATGPFMRHFYTLQKALQKRPSRSSIIQAAVNLSNLATAELLNSIQEKKVITVRTKTTNILQTGQPGMIAVVRSVEKANQLLYQALAKLSCSGQGIQEVGQVTYRLVCLFDTTMKTLQQQCKVQAEQPPLKTKSNTSSTKTKKTTKGKRAATSRIPEPLSKTGDEVVTQITWLLGSMALSLDITRPEYQQLLEGFMFSLLTRVGELLCLFVFQDLHLHPDLRVDSSLLPLPKGLTGVELNDESLKAAQMEAKHLIWLLERILAFIDATPPTVSSSSSPNTAAFISKTKERLQSTLLQAVFGSDATTFQNSFPHLIGPDKINLEQLQAFTQTPNQTTPDWFVQEVWRLLGWDMLANTSPPI